MRRPTLFHFYLKWCTAWFMAVSVLLFSAQAAAQNVMIGALVSGQVTAVKVKEGEVVKAGGLLLEIDQQAYRAKLAYLKADVSLKKAQWEDAKVELGQALDLFDRTVTARRTLDAAQLQHDIAQAQVDKADAKLKKAQAWAKYYKIRAPFKAKVVKIHTPMGATVFKEHTPMIELQQP